MVLNSQKYLITLYILELNSRLDKNRKLTRLKSQPEDQWSCKRSIAIDVYGSRKNTKSKFRQFGIVVKLVSVKQGSSFINKAHHLYNRCIPRVSDAPCQVSRSSHSWFWGRRFLKVLTILLWAWRPSLTCDHYHSYKLPFALPMEAPIFDLALINQEVPEKKAFENNVYIHEQGQGQELTNPKG